MMTTSTASDLGQRSDRLAELAESDPRNLSLLSEAAEAALAAHRPELAQTLLLRYAAEARLPEHEANLAGLAAMQMGEFDKAADQFRTLLDKHPGEPALRFNLAWCLAMAKDADAALSLLNDATTQALPQAATLKVQLLHDQGEFDDAFSLGKAMLERHAGSPALLASMSVLAMDLEEPELAQEWAAQAGGHPDARTTLGVLALGRQDYGQASALFDEALAKTPQSARALVGKGLVALAGNDPKTAAASMEEGAAIFAEHIGSWIGAGWAHLLANDLVASRRCFEKAYAIDDTFAESHGSLAVLDVFEGRIEDAERKIDIALRLDRDCFSAAIAKTCLATAAGQTEIAQRTFQKFLTTQIARAGITVADALARLSLKH